MASDVEFIIAANDKASPIYRSLDGLIRRVVSSAAAEHGKLKAATDRTAQSTDNLSRFVRAQRTEQREQTFLFREGAQAIGAASTALTLFNISAEDASEQSRRLNQALNQGFVAFQSVTFLLAGLNPLLAATAAAAAGLAVAFGVMSKEGEKLRDMSGFLSATMSEFAGFNLEQLNTALKLQDDLVKANNASIDAMNKKLNETPSAPAVATQSPILAFAAALAGVKTKIEGVKLTEEEIAELEAEIFRLQTQNTDALKLRGLVADQITAANERAAKERRAEADRILEEAKKAQAILDKLAAGGKDEAGLIRNIDADIARQFADEAERAQRAIGKMVAEQKPKGVRQGESPDARFGITSTLDQVSFGIEEMTNVANRSADLIIATYQDASVAIVEAMFGATQSIMQFFENMAKRILQLIVDVLLAKLIGSILKVPLLFGTAPAASPASIASRAGGFAPSAAGGGSAQLSGGRPIVININNGGGAAQAFAVTSIAERRRIIQVLEQAAFSEKA